jgi:hypothetical protein
MDAANEKWDAIIAWRSRYLPMCNAALNLARNREVPQRITWDHDDEDGDDEEGEAMQDAA